MHAMRIGFNCGLAVKNNPKAISFGEIEEGDRSLSREQKVQKEYEELRLNNASLRLNGQISEKTYQQNKSRFNNLEEIRLCQLKHGVDTCTVQSSKPKAPGMMKKILKFLGR